MNKETGRFRNVVKLLEQQDKHLSQQLSQTQGASAVPVAPSKHILTSKEANTNQHIYCFSRMRYTGNVSSSSDIPFFNFLSIKCFACRRGPGNFHKNASIGVFDCRHAPFTIELTLYSKKAESISSSRRQKTVGMTLAQVSPGHRFSTHELDPDTLTVQLAPTTAKVAA
jgi:hypothetical protein